MFPESLSFSIPCCVSLLLNGTARLLCHRPRPADGRKHVEPGSRFINLPVIIAISYAPEAPSFAAFSTPEVSTGCSASAVFAFFSPPPPLMLLLQLCPSACAGRKVCPRIGGGGGGGEEEDEEEEDLFEWSTLKSVGTVHHGRVLQVVCYKCYKSVVTRSAHLLSQKPCRCTHSPLLSRKQRPTPEP